MYLVLLKGSFRRLDAYMAAIFFTNVMSLLPTPPAQTCGIGVGSFSTRPVFFVGPPRSVLFEMLTTGMIRMVQTVIIDNSVKGQSQIRLRPVKTTYDLKKRRSPETTSDYHPPNLIAVTYIMSTAIIMGSVWYKFCMIIEDR